MVTFSSSLPSASRFRKRELSERKGMEKEKEERRKSEGKQKKKK